MSYNYYHFNVTSTNLTPDGTLIVIINATDTILSKKYQRTYNIADLTKYGTDPITFSKMCVDCLNCYNKNLMYVVATKDSIIVTLHYSNNEVSQEFILELFLQDEPVTIQKLSKEVKECRELIQKYINTIKLYDSFINSVEIPVYDYTIDVKNQDVAKFSASITLPLVCPKICITGYCETIGKQIDSNKVDISIVDIAYFNVNFQKIICNEISLDCVNDHSIDMSNFPITTEKLRIYGCSYIYDIVGLLKMTNLKEIIIEECRYFMSIYDSIKNLNVKNVIIKNCPAFRDKEKILANNIKCDVDSIII